MRIHFIGIGGISMSGLASIALTQGHTITGSDSSTSNITQILENKGIKIYKDHKAQNIVSTIDMVVFTAAIKKDNPELVEAIRLNIKTLERSEFLGALMAEYNNSYAVAGTHGKTSTTSMLTTILLMAESDPTVLVGGNLPSIGGNIRIGHSQNFVAEACEYVDSFLQFFPRTSIILNIEEDHLDYFSGLEQIKQSFYKFSQNTKSDGFVIANGDDDNVYDSLQSSDPIFFGVKDRNIAQIIDIQMTEKNSIYSIKYNNTILGPFTVNIPGFHNIQNSTAAILAAYLNNVDLDIIKQGISSYKGVGRRFDYKGDYNDAKIYDDYAHHPTEIKSTLEAASLLNKNRLIVVFQPHTYSRTKELLDEFADSFGKADLTIITDIYASREIDNGMVHSLDLVSKMDKNKTLYLSNFQQLEQYLLTELKPNDICFTMGAGNIFEIGEALIKKK